MLTGRINQVTSGAWRIGAVRPFCAGFVGWWWGAAELSLILHHRPPPDMWILETPLRWFGCIRNILLVFVVVFVKNKK